MYKRGYLIPWLKCISCTERHTLLEESHAGEGGAHEGARALTGKILRLGLYWTDVYKDATKLPKKFTKCQTFTPSKISLMRP